MKFYVGILCVWVLLFFLSFQGANIYAYALGHMNTNLNTMEKFTKKHQLRDVCREYLG